MQKDMPCVNTILLNRHLAETADKDFQEEKRREALEAEAEDIMGECAPETVDCLAFEAVGNDDATTEALCAIIRDYDDSPRIELSKLDYNHKLVCRLIESVKEYVVNGLEAEQ